jgi:hypothetical protein
MSTKLIVTALNNNKLLKSQMSVEAWVSDQDARGEKVTLFREYADGEHRANMTQEMRDLLRIGGASANVLSSGGLAEPRGRNRFADVQGGYSAFTDNRMDNIIQTMVDRLEVKRIEDTETAKQKREKTKTMPFSHSGMIEAQTTASALYQPPPQVDKDGNPVKPAKPPTPPKAANGTQPPVDPNAPPTEPKVEYTVNDWLLDVLKKSRFDALQIEVHESAIRDGDTFVLVDWDAEKQCVRFTHEPAYNGVKGMLVMYEKQSQSEIKVAVKVWHITTTNSDSMADTMRVNVYYPDRIEKFISEKGQELKPFTEGSGNGKHTLALDDIEGHPYTTPQVVHFKNKSQPYDNYGRSEIDDAIPLQDALNRMMHSMVASAELGGFPIRTHIGFEPPSGLSPGGWVGVSTTVGKDDRVEIGTMEQGEITPFLEAAHYLIDEIDNITRTPNPKNMGGDNASGEALKQREMGLLGKVKRAQISFGNAWEDVCKLAHAVETAYGEKKPPPFEQFSVEWRSAEIRNTTEEVDNILKISSMVGDEMTIRLLANVFDWSEDEIHDILTKKQAEAENRASMISSMIPGFANSNPNRFGGGNQQQQQQLPAQAA